VRRPEADPIGRATRRAGAKAPAPYRARPEGGSPANVRLSRIGNGLLALGLAAPLVAAASLSPAAVDGGPIVCWLRAATGLRCPFCGMTRSFVYLAHGALAAAARAHPAGPLLFAALAVAAGTRAGFLRAAQTIGIVCIAAGLVAHALEKQDGPLLDLLHAG
jgi:uncharacterized protein DUF2752